MSGFFHYLLRFLFHLGYLGPLIMGILDSSFLFLPFGNDLLVVALVARHHDGYPIVVLTAAAGSVMGVFLLDLIARRLGEEGIRKLAGNKRYERLRRKIGQKGAAALIVGSLAPPPFPFTMVVAVNSALDYPRRRLLLVVAAGRAVRFLILGALAIKFGRTIIRWSNSEGFKNVMIAFILICLAGSAYSIHNWIRKGRPKRRIPPKDQPARA
ncbi:MAG: VTT domain-containing protein [Acidobacteriaceae bacterium]|nr:VTT domain-containing protein [Acidobacteriaceae bacterium]